MTIIIENIWDSLQELDLKDLRNTISHPNCNFDPLLGWGNVEKVHYPFLSSIHSIV
jgi:hypothetical protein